MVKDNFDSRRKAYKKFINDKEFLTYIYMKQENNLELTKEELRFI